MFEMLAKMYAAGTLDDEGLARAVDKGWITQDQADEITAGT